MRTTIELPDDLFRQAKARAAMSGITLKELMTRCLEEGLKGFERLRQGNERQRSEPPIVRAATGRSLPVFTHAELHSILDED